MGRYVMGQVVLEQARFETTAILGEELLLGTAYTSLTVGSLPAPIAVGDVLTLSSVPNNTVTVTASGTAAAGDTSIAIQSFTPTQNWLSGTQLSYLADPTVVKVKYVPGKSAIEVTLTYSPAGSGANTIIRASKGVYFVAFDTTTGKVGSWDGAWESTGIAQAYQQFSFPVAAAPL